MGRRTILVVILGLAACFGDQPTEPVYEAEGASFLAAPPPPPAPPTVLTGELAANEGGPSQVDLGDYETPVYSKVTVSGLLGYQGAGGYLPGTGQVDASGVVIQNQCDLSVVIRSATGPVFASPSCPSQPRQIDTYTRYAVVNGHLDAYRTTGPPGSCWKYPAPCIHFTGSQSITVEPQEGTIVLTPSKTSVAPGGGIVVTAKGVWAENSTTLVPMTVRAWTWEGSGPEVGGGHTKVCAAYNTNQCTVQVYQSGRVVLEALVNGKVKTQSVEIAVVGGDTLPLPPVDTIPTDTIPTDTIPGGGGGGGGCGGAGSSSDCGGGPDSSVVHVIASRPEMLPLVTGMSFDANLQQNYTGGFSGLPRHFEEAGRPDTTWLEITVRQRKDGTSPAGAQIQLTMTPLEESGGHIHTQGLARPTGSFYRSSAASQRTGPGSDRGTITLTTDSSGKVKVLYRTSGLAGVEIIEVKTVDAQHPAKPDTVRLTLRVPGLVEMDSMHQDRYVFKPQDPSKPAQQHGNNNRWVLPAFRDSVLEVFDGFWLNSGMVVDDSSYDHLYITDAGLPWGGLFDYHGDSEWSSPHQTHRIGNDLDLRSSSLSAGARAILQRECRARGAKLPTGTTNRVDRCTPEGDHIHIEGLNR